jgi:radical SAM protein (TIGR01212 family)
MKFLAYFQAYTNTYESIDKLKRMYEEALSVEDVIGIVIGTRPDCVSDELLDYLGHLNTQTFITIEYGIETANNNTLKLINRGHDFECVKRIVSKTAEKGIITGGHIILGLPGEDSEEIIRQAPLISALPINILKLHQLQVIHGTKLEQMYKEHPFHLFSPDEYIELIGRYIKLLRKDIVIERFTSQSPKDMLVGPQWGMKNHEFTDKLMRYLRENNIYQGQDVILP